MAELEGLLVNEDRALLEVAYSKVAKVRQGLEEGDLEESAEYDLLNANLAILRTLLGYNPLGPGQ